MGGRVRSCGRGWAGHVSHGEQVGGWEAMRGGGAMGGREGGKL